MARCPTTEWPVISSKRNSIGVNRGVKYCMLQTTTKVRRNEAELKINFIRRLFLYNISRYNQIYYAYITYKHNNGFTTLPRSEMAILRPPLIPNSLSGFSIFSFIFIFIRFLRTQKMAFKFTCVVLMLAVVFLAAQAKHVKKDKSKKKGID